MENRVLEQIQRWANDLVDVSKRNTSLYYKPSKRGSVEVVAPSADDLFASVIAGDTWRFHVPPGGSGQPPYTVEDARARAKRDELVTTRTAAGDLDLTLRSLTRQADLDLVDRGVYSLYLCFGMLTWQEDVAGDEWAKSPLLYVSVQVRRATPRDAFTLVATENDTVINPSLRVVLSQRYGIELPEWRGGEGGDPPLTVTLADVDRIVGGRGWSIEPSVVLKRATFHKEAMYRDLIENAATVAAHPIVAALADPALALTRDAADGVPGEDEVDSVAAPEDAHLILDADASQRRAVAAAVTGHSFVMDGPPGTGKSQTIANIIAELVAAGRSVLFVSEKVAALEVVGNRLSDRGLDALLLELHSNAVSRREVAKALGKALHERPVGRPRLSDVDRARARDLRERLGAHSAAMNEQRAPLGRTPSWIVGRLAQLRDAPVLGTPAGIGDGLGAGAASTLQDAFARLERVWAPVEDGDDFLWRGLLPLAAAQPTQELALLLDELDAALGDVDDLGDALAYEAGLGTPASIAEASVLRDVVTHAAQQPETVGEWWSAPDLVASWSRYQELRAELAERASVMTALADHVGPDWRTVSPADARSVNDALDILRSAGRAAPPPSAATAAVLVQRRELAEATVALCDGLDSESRLLCTSLGAPLRDRSVRETLDLAVVAAAADEPVRPDPSWAAPAVAARARKAVAALRPLVADYQRRHAALAERFDDGIYDLDLAMLLKRFEELHKGVRKLGSAYRADKRAVRAVMRGGGKVDESVRTALREALAIQQLAAGIDAKEQRTREVLGTHYRPRATDCDAALHALDVLATAVHRLGGEYDPEHVAAQLAGDSPSDPTLGTRGRALVARIENWRQSVEAVFGTDRLATLNLHDLHSWASLVAEKTRALEASWGRLAPSGAAGGTLGDLERDARDRVAVDAIETRLQAARATDTALLGSYAAAADTDLAALDAALSWTQELRELHNGPLPPRAVAQLHARHDPPSADPLRSALDRVEKARNELVTSFEPTRGEELDRELESSLNAARELVQTLGATTEQIDVYLQFDAIVRHLREEGWDGPLDRAVQQRIPREQVRPALERSLWTAWFDAVTRADSRLKDSVAHELDACVAEFRALDRRLIEDGAERVIQAAAARRPTAVLGAAGIIKREAEKKTRHMPVRKLLQETRDVALSLKPVFMMSPLSVSQLLPPEFRFDVVIFDEASQIAPADAINCMYRGDQIIVAGDDKQLPPTSFFQVGLDADGDGEYDEEQFDDFESVLSLCKSSAGLEELPLRWHYRSQHDALITFSNYRFYDGRLVTFPGAVVEGDDRGVEHVLVEGIYRRGSSRDNPVEAETVAKRVLRHAELRPELTLGVVAFSQAQADLIQTYIERARETRPELDAFFTGDRLGGFFVKNLESVQGDERDIMIFSVGYGPDENGKLTLNFGPLNRDGGWRRLNVAVTRARRRVELVTSFEAGRLDVRGAVARGVQELQRYIDYAAHGPAALAVDLTQSSGDVESPLEESVLSAIRGWGYDVVPQVGTAGYRIDMAVRHRDRPGEWALGVECDGAMYHSSKIARDRDRLRQEVLENLGWRLHRIWGPSWYRERPAQEQRLRDAIESAFADNPVVTAKPAASVRVERAAELIDFDAPPEWAELYRPATLVVPAHASRELPSEPTVVQVLTALVRQVVQSEAPIHIDLLTRRVAHAWGRNATRKVGDAVSRVVTGLIRGGVCTRDGDFVLTDAPTVVRVPDPGDEATRRVAEHIPPPEMQEAVYLLLRDSLGADVEEVVLRVSRLFGFMRTGNRVRAAVEQSIDSLVEDGWVERDGAGRLRALAEQDAK